MGQSVGWGAGSKGETERSGMIIRVLIDYTGFDREVFFALFL